MAHTSANLRQVIIEVSYLKSYVNMGKASVTCVSGCTCEQTKIDAHNQEKNSQVWNPNLIWSNI